VNLVLAWFFIISVERSCSLTLQELPMSRLLFSLILLFPSFLTGFSQKRKSKEPTSFTIQQLAPGVWAAIHNDQSGRAICNAGIVDLGDKTLVFDPFMTPQAANELRTVAEQLTQRPVTLVIDSHFHSDHIRGNQEFKPFATIVSSTATRDEIEKEEPSQEAWDKQNVPVLLQAANKRYRDERGTDMEETALWINYYKGIQESIYDVKMTLPDIVFNDSLWIMGSVRSVKLVEFKNCHTVSDVVMLLPNDHIAFMGDLLFVQRHPWLADGNPATWEAKLGNFCKDDSIKVYVPGHGGVCDREGVKVFHDYLNNLQKMATTASTDSTQYETIIGSIPNEYQSWHFSKFYQQNMKFMIGNMTKQDK
jgi:cyclase